MWRGPSNSEAVDERTGNDVLGNGGGEDSECESKERKVGHVELRDVKVELAKWMRGA